MITREEPLGFRTGGVITVPPETSLARAAQKMRDSRVGALLVVDPSGKAVGILSERDIVHRATAVSAVPDEVAVAEVMTPTLISCSTTTPVSEAHQLMVSHGVRHVPVLQDGVPVGIISSRDLLARQLLVNEGMKATAEEVALMGKGLTSLDMDEVLGMAISSVPAIFRARRCVLHVAQRGGKTARPPLIRRKACACDEEDLLQCEDIVGSEVAPGVYGPSVPPACRGAGCEGPMVFIPLGGPGPAQDCGSLQGLDQDFLCMCGLVVGVAASEELLRYKVALVHDVLNVFLANARMYTEARRVSMTDAVTGLGTRRALDERLAEEWQRAVRYGRPFSVAMIDVDSLKVVNDRRGHAAGDQALRALSDLVRENCRANDFAARYGGDEFVVLMPETGLEDATAALERLRQRVEGTVGSPRGPGVTISCGIAAWSARLDESADHVVRRADNALYEAKRAGRNRVAPSPLPVASTTAPP